MDDNQDIFRNILFRDRLLDAGGDADVVLFLTILAPSSLLIASVASSKDEDVHFILAFLYQKQSMLR